MKSINLFLNLFSFLAVVWFKIDTVEGIAGGKDAKPGQIPYHASITSQNRRICNGAIVDRRNVLAVGHCFINNQNVFEDLIYNVLIGTVDLQVGGGARVEIGVEKIFIPRNFGTTDLGKATESFMDDLAVVRTTSDMPLKDGSAVNLVPMAWPQQPVGSIGIDYIPKEAGTVSGFGEKQLKVTDANVIRSDKCAKLDHMPIGNHQLCAQVKQPCCSFSSHTCEDDNGSPLVIKEAIIGLLSSPTVTCSEKKQAAIYSKVAYFGDFIRHSLNQEISFKVLRFAEYVIKDDGSTSLQEVPLSPP